MKNWLGRNIRVKVKPVGTAMSQHSASSGMSGSARDGPRAPTVCRNAASAMTTKNAAGSTSAIALGSAAA
jgi:hypothetical protein